MEQNSENTSDFFRLSYGTGKGIETLEEQRAINSGGVQMITIRKPLEPFIKFGQIDAKRLEFDSIGKLLQQGKDYERLLLHDGNSQGGRPNLPKTTDSHNAGDAFAEGVAELRRKLQEPPSLDGGQKTVQDSLGSRAGSTGEVRPSTGLTPKEAGERIAQELKDAPNFTEGIKDDAEFRRIF